MSSIFGMSSSNEFYIMGVIKIVFNYCLAYSRVLTWVVETLLTTLVEGLEVCCFTYYYGERVLGQLLPNNTSMGTIHTLLHMKIIFLMQALLLLQHFLHFKIEQNCAN